MGLLMYTHIVRTLCAQYEYRCKIGLVPKGRGSARDLKRNAKNDGCNY